MKRSFVLKNKNIKRLKLDYITVILSTIFFCGIIIGVTLIKNCDDDFKNTLFNFLNNFLSTKSQGSFLSVFSGLLVILLLFVFFEFIFGLSAVGTPLILIFLVLFGAFFGAETACIILNWGLKGIFYFLLVNLPCYTITAAILIKCCCVSVNMSFVLLNCLLCKDSIKRNVYDFKEYILNYLILILPIVIGVLISTIFFKVFCTLFVVL